MVMELSHPLPPKPKFLDETLLMQNLVVNLIVPAFSTCHVYTATYKCKKKLEPQRVYTLLQSSKQ